MIRAKEFVCGTLRMNCSSISLEQGGVILMKPGANCNGVIPRDYVLCLKCSQALHVLEENTPSVIPLENIEVDLPYQPLEKIRIHLGKKLCLALHCHGSSTGSTAVSVRLKRIRE